MINWLETEEPTVDAWAEQETAYEAFMAHYSHIDVVRMSNADFDRWQAEYKRLYDALWDAQIAYYKAIRA
jgi:hypothetical protein